MSRNPAATELANVARELLARLVEIDTELPGSIAEAIHNKIEFYSPE